jgi:hypothetical protein
LSLDHPSVLHHETNPLLYIPLEGRREPSDTDISIGIYVSSSATLLCIILEAAIESLKLLRLMSLMIGVVPIRNR